MSRETEQANMVARLKQHPDWPRVKALYDAGETRIEVISAETGLPRDTIRAMLRNLAADDPRFAEWAREDGVKKVRHEVTVERLKAVTESENRFVRLGATRVRLILEEAQRLGAHRKDKPASLALRFHVPRAFVTRILALGTEAIALAVQADKDWKAKWVDPVEVYKRRRQQEREEYEVDPDAKPEMTPAPALGAVPVEVQRQIVEAWRRGYSVDDIEGLLMLQRDQVLTVLQDQGYAISVAQAEHRAQGIDS